MIEIISIRRLHSGGSVQAFVDFSINDKIEIRGAKIIQQAGQNPWVAMPDRSYEADGQTRWTKIVQILDAGLKEKLERAVLAAFEANHKESDDSFGGIKSDEIPKPAGYKEKDADLTF